MVYSINEQLKRQERASGASGSSRSVHASLREEEIQMGFKREALAQEAENDAQAAVGWLPEDPLFPSPEDAQDINAAAVGAYGEDPYHLQNSGALESALSNAENHYHGMFGQIADDASRDPHERLLESIAKMGYGTAESQAFVNGNKRTTAAMMSDVANANGMPHIFPEDHDDEEIADHLLGWGIRDENDNPRHSIQQTTDMLKQRHANGGPDRSYVSPYPEDHKDRRWNS